MVICLYSLCQAAYTKYLFVATHQNKLWIQLTHFNYCIFLPLIQGAFLYYIHGLFMFILHIPHIIGFCKCFIHEYVCKSHLTTLLIHSELGMIQPRWFAFFVIFFFERMCGMNVCFLFLIFVETFCFFYFTVIVYCQFETNLHITKQLSSLINIDKFLKTITCLLSLQWYVK